MIHQMKQQVTMMKRILALYVVLHLTASLVAAKHDSIYCTFKCKEGEDTMCIYKENVPGRNCKNFDDTHLLSPYQKQQILDQHNDYRGQAARGEVPGHPAAKEMPALTWSSELDRLAKRWAYQCSFDHDPCRHTKDGEIAGQNIGKSQTTAGYREDYTRRFRTQFEEYKNYKPDSKNHYPEHHGNKKVGHYTQIVWAKTLYIGCEQTVYNEERKGKRDFVTTLIVCVYSPAGNFIGEQVYEPLPSGRRGKLGPASPPRPGETGLTGAAPGGGAPGGGGPGGGAPGGGVPGGSTPGAVPSVGQRNSVHVLTAVLIIAVHSAYVT